MENVDLRIVSRRMCIVAAIISGRIPHYPEIDASRRQSPGGKKKKKRKRKKKGKEKVKLRVIDVVAHIIIYYVTGSCPYVY